MKKILPLAFLLNALTGGTQCNDLFISQYIEGSSFNKVIEIYNPTSFNIPLSGLFAIRIYFNGSTSPTTINLTGTINANSTYVIAHSSASAPILALANQTNAGLTFNGDDAVELFNIFYATTSDMIGVIGIDPGTEWLVNGSSGTVDHTLTRIASVQQGTSVWTGVGEMQWTILPIDDITGLGSHSMTPCALPQPTVSATHSGDTCVGLTVFFTSTVSGGTPGYNYFWDFGDASPVDNNVNPIHTYTAPGTYNVTLVVIDQNLQDDTTNVVVTIYPYANALFAMAGVTANGCAADTFLYSNMSTSSVSYNWDLGDGNNFTGLVPPVHVYNAGNFTIILYAIGMAGCNDTASQNITVLPIPNVTLLSGDTVLCNAAAGVNLYAASGGVWSGAYTTDNTNGNGYFASMGAPGGTYYAVYSYSNACGSDEDSVQVIVDTDPVAGFTYTPAGNLITFTNTSVNGNSYLWDFGGLGTSTQTDTSYIFANGNYTICLDAYSANGACMDTDCQNITVVGIDENAVQLFNMYPVPASNSITVQLVTSDKYTFLLYDISQRVVMAINMHGMNRAEINLEKLPQGSYQAVLTNENQQFMRPLIITR